MNKMRERQGDRVRTVTWDGQNERQRQSSGDFKSPKSAQKPE